MDNNQELEKAAAKYMIDNLHYHDSDGVDVAEVFKAGAQWQDEQDKYWSTAFSFNEKSKIYENRCLEAIEILKRYREAMQELLIPLAIHTRDCGCEAGNDFVAEFICGNHRAANRCHDTLITPIPEWMKEHLK